nr:reverse transcriptase domain-containing protein [Tanacetum cinerariifolium]
RGVSRIHSLSRRDYDGPGEGSSGLRRSSAMPCFFIHVIYAISLSLYPFTERYAQPYFFSCLIRQGGDTILVSEPGNETFGSRHVMCGEWVVEGPIHSLNIAIVAHIRNMQRSTDEEDLSQPRLCKETDLFTPRICNRKVPKRTCIPTNVKTYDGTGDPEDHLKIFQTTTKIEQWAMPTWCHMFNSTLIGLARVGFDTLPLESIDSYVVLRKAFLRNFLQEKKYIKDPIEIHHIRQREGELSEPFMERFKAESMHVNGAPECMRVSKFMHNITNPGRSNA